MPLLQVAAVGDGAVVFSLNLDSARTVVGWHLQNNLPKSVKVDLVAGPLALRQSFAAGGHTGSVAKNRQWNHDTATDVSYSLTVGWP